MLVHDENPRILWKLAIIESLEVRAQEQIPQTDDETDETFLLQLEIDLEEPRPWKLCKKWLIYWARKLRAAPEDIE